MNTQKLRQHTLLEDGTIAAEHLETSADVVLFDNTDTDLESDTLQDAVVELSDQMSQREIILVNEMNDFIPSEVYINEDQSITEKNQYGEKLTTFAQDRDLSIITERFSKTDGTTIIKTTTIDKDKIITTVGT